MKNTNYLFQLFIIMSFFMSLPLFAQHQDTSINPFALDLSFSLDVKSENSGVSIPKVSELTNNNVTSSIKNPATDYMELTDCLKILNDKVVDLSVEYVIKEKEKNYEYRALKLQRIKAFLISIIIIIAVLLFFFYRKLKLERINRIKNTELLKKKEEKLERLTDANKVTLEEVVQLVRNKDASFFIKFQELYPDFIEKLATKTEKEVTLIHSELILCAMIKLGFTTKEIAQNLNSNVSAVESRKYRLRKKFNMVSSDEDLTIWMMNL